VAVAALGLALALSLPVQAKTFHCRAGDVQCLIDAIHTANANGEKNTIRLEAGTYTLTAVDNMTDGPNGLPSVTSTLTIRGEGAETTSIERPSFGPSFRILHAAGDLTLTGLTLRGGSLPPIGQVGGGIFNSGTLTLHDSTLTRNGGGSRQGGAIFNSGTLTLRHCTLSQNSFPLASGNSGGGLYNSGGRVTIAYTTFADNSVEDGGGGLYNNDSGTVTITHTTFADNLAIGGGGALLNVGTATLTHTTFVRNQASGIGNFGTLTLTSSTLRDSTPIFGGSGISNHGSLMILNSTLSGNTAFSGGGGIDNVGRLMILNSTLSGNTALFGGSGGILSRSSGSVALQNTILALNTVEDSPSPDCAGPVTSLGHNLIGDSTGCTLILQPSDLTGDPGLGLFTDNGRPGNGHFPLLPTSQAIDAGDDAACPRRDQLGQRRVNIPGVGTSRCDIGAIEFPGKDDRQHREKDDDHQHDQDLAAAAQAAQ
jgi:hypothetical protein